MILNPILTSKSITCLSEFKMRTKCCIPILTMIHWHQYTIKLLRNEIMKNIKTFNVRLEKSLWIFLKKEAAIRETSMTELITFCIEKFKKKCDKKELTKSGADV
jgi:hypothetical protein